MMRKEKFAGHWPALGDCGVEATDSVLDKSPALARMT